MISQTLELKKGVHYFVFNMDAAILIFYFRYCLVSADTDPVQKHTAELT